MTLDVLPAAFNAVLYSSYSRSSFYGQLL